MIYETVESVLEVKHTRENIPSCATLETYEEMPIFIPVDNTEEVVKLVVRKLWGDSDPGVKESESLQVWVLKFGCDSKRIRTIVGTFLTGQPTGAKPVRPIVDLCLAD